MLATTTPYSLDRVHLTQKILQPGTAVPIVRDGGSAGGSSFLNEFGFPFNNPVTNKNAALQNIIVCPILEGLGL